MSSQNDNQSQNLGVEINLLPDVKFELLRTKVLRNRVSAFALVIVALSLAITAILAVYAFVAQDVMIASVDENIKKEFEKYKNYENVNQIITVQNQLSKIDKMHQEKSISSRIFSLLVSVVDGSGKLVRVSRLTYNTTSSQITIEGQSRDGFVGIEALQKSILATQMFNQQDPKVKFALTDKVYNISPASYGTDTSGNAVLIFNIGFKADPRLFESLSDVVLVGAGRQDVTDSALVIPKDIFAPTIIQQETDFNQQGDE